jgi:hypothetical protein
VRRFEAELYSFLDNSKPELLQLIRDKRELNDEVKTQLKDALNELKQRFQSAKTQKPETAPKQTNQPAGPSANGAQRAQTAPDRETTKAPAQV